MLREGVRTVNSPQTHWDFFLAHAGKDTPLAEDLYDRLYQTARTFLDSRSLLLGDDWDHGLLRQCVQGLCVAVGA